MGFKCFDWHWLHVFIHKISKGHPIMTAIKTLPPMRVIASPSSLCNNEIALICGDDGCLDKIYFSVKAQLTVHASSQKKRAAVKLISFAYNRETEYSEDMVIRQKYIFIPVPALNRFKRLWFCNCFYRTLRVFWTIWLLFPVEICWSASAGCCSNDNKSPWRKVKPLK